VGRLGVTLRAHLLLAVGAVLIVAGIYLLTCSPGWALLAAGVLTALYALLLVDVPAPASPDPSGVTRVGR
jgi:hypothetical protein